MRRSTRRVVTLGVISFAAMLTAPAAEAQDRAYRIDIIGVRDSTIVLRTTDARWMRPGQQGLAVDPRRRDALVARFRLLTVHRDSAEALITGQTTQLSLEHIAIVVRQQPPFYRVRQFWLGLLGGAGVGFIIGRI